MMLPQVLIKRNPDDGKQTLGKLSFTKKDGGLFTLFTLELPWLNNQHGISCIPKTEPGKPYLCKWLWSDDHQMFNYHIMDVPDREGCEIHSANLVSQLKGCIALGLGEADINNDGQLDVINSRAAINAFVDLLEKQDFELTII